MPTITSYTPKWLSKGAPGYNVFAPTKDQMEAPPPRNAIRAAPKRTVARRGTSEIFVAVGKEIRWADLARLKEPSENQTQANGFLTGKNHGGGSDDDKQDPGWRWFKTKVHDEIRQLVMSPNEELMAIVTTHTVYIAVLPTSDRLKSTPKAEAKAKDKAEDRDQFMVQMHMYQLGPEIHVTTRSAVASVLWHPLGKGGDCVVTVTEDSVVRVWEVDLRNRKSLDDHLSIDLSKLAQGTWSDQDFAASKLQVREGYSPDSFDMEVASACFGERDSGGWSPMTLWIAMREGDVYALCPLLPKKWSPPPLLTASLSVSIVSKATLAEEDDDLSEQEKLACKQQLQWIQDLDMQDATTVEEDGTETEVYTRPAKPGAIPRLQGPFDIEFQQEEGEDEEVLLSDITIIGAKLDSEELMFGEEDSLLSDDTDSEGLSMNVVCLLTSSGRVTLCLDLDGVEAQWLPHSKSNRYSTFSVPEDPSLLAFQAVETLRPAEVDEESWPMFSRDCSSRYSFFVTSTSSIKSISLSPWVFRLEKEIKGNGSSPGGLAVRLGNLVKGPHSQREYIYIHRTSSRSRCHLAASVILRDPDLGYVLLSATFEGPIMLSLGSPEANLRDSPTPSQGSYDEEQRLPPQLFEPRIVYQPHPDLDTPSRLPNLLENLRHNKYKKLMNEHVRLSHATLDMMTSVHGVVADESANIREAAAELFRRCYKLQEELREQIRKSKEVAEHIDDVVPSALELRRSKEAGGEDEKGNDQKADSNEIVEARIAAAKKRQSDLMLRLNTMRTKLKNGGGRELGAKEIKWGQELRQLAEDLNLQKLLNPEPEVAKSPKPKSEAPGGDKGTASDDDATVDGKDATADSKVLTAVHWQRYQNIKALTGDLVAQAKHIEDQENKNEGKESGDASSPSLGRSGVRVPNDIRAAKVDHINSMLERETILVENTKRRLEGLSSTM